MKHAVEQGKETNNATDCREDYRAKDLLCTTRVLNCIFKERNAHCLKYRPYVEDQEHECDSILENYIPSYFPGFHVFISVNQGWGYEEVRESFDLFKDIRNVNLGLIKVFRSDSHLNRPIRNVKSQLAILIDSINHLFSKVSMCFHRYPSHLGSGNYCRGRRKTIVKT